MINDGIPGGGIDPYPLHVLADGEPLEGGLAGGEIQYPDVFDADGRIEYGRLTILLPFE